MNRPTAIILLRLFRRVRQREDKATVMDQSSLSSVQWWREQWWSCALTYAVQPSNVMLFIHRNNIPVNRPLHRGRVKRDTYNIFPLSKKGDNPKNINFTGEERRWLSFTHDKCCDWYDIPHLYWLFLQMELSSFHLSPRTISWIVRHT
jgi:hypothetical protein